MADDAGTGPGTPGGTQTDTPAAGKTFSQDELNKILARERDKAERKFQKDLEARLASERDTIAAELEEQQRLGEETAKLAKENRQLKSDLTKTSKSLEAERAKLGKLTSTQAKAAIVSAAAGKAVDPDDVWSIVRDRVRVNDDLDVVVLDENGEPSDTTPTQLVEGLLAAKTHLALPTGPTSGSGSRPASMGEVRQHRPERSQFATSEDRVAFLEKHRDVIDKR